MKKMILCIAAFFACIGASAQFDTRSEVLADIEKSGGVHYMYPMYDGATAPAPKGYKPFYISHLGRHGARYALGDYVYEELLSIWTRGHEKGLLTEEGEKIYAAYTEMYPLLAHREGNLTFKGQDQHRFIAAQMYRRFKPVFKGKTRVEAVSTVSHRVIVSMYSCLDELRGLDKDLSYGADYGYPYQEYLLPSMIDAPSAWPDSVQRKRRAYYRTMVDEKAILSRWFTSPYTLVKNPENFLRDMQTVISTLDNTDVPYSAVLYGALRPEERYGIWAWQNYREYLLLGMSPQVQNVRPESMKALVKDFIDKADADISSGAVQLRLRFAHDSTLMPLLSLLGVNNWGARLCDPDAINNAWRNFDIPMATNLQLVFFRSKKSPEILFQILLNGKEATLPLEMAAPGSFYRWRDFVSYAATL